MEHGFAWTLVAHLGASADWPGRVFDRRSRRDSHTASLCAARNSASVGLLRASDRRHRDRRRYDSSDAVLSPLTRLVSPHFINVVCRVRPVFPVQLWKASSFLLRCEPFG